MPILRTLFLLLLCNAFLVANAQNYECIKPLEKQYFLAADGYLRGMRIDSTRTSGDTTFYYPFHTPRGPINKPLNLKGASWFGSEIIALKDGTYWFFNQWQDTLELRTQAKLHEKWVCFRDTNDIYYEAEITSVDTATIKGVSDSIKTITISAYDKNGVITSAAAHGLKYIVSKHHGFYETNLIYFFPYHHPGDDSAWVKPEEDYFIYDLGWHGQFRLYDFKNPRLNDIYNYSVGDIYFVLDEPLSYHSGANIYFYDSVAAVNPVVGGKEYTIQRTSHYPTYHPSSPSHPSGYVTYDTSYSSYHIVADSTPLVRWLPEETGNPEIYHVLLNDSSYCSKGIMYKIRNALNISGIVPTVDIRIEKQYYKEKLGRVYHSKEKVLAARFEAFTRDMKYYRFGNKGCGGYLWPTNIPVIENDNEVSIYPNPTTGSTVYIDIPKDNGNSARLTIYNTVGRQLMAKSISNHETVDVSSLPSGVYLFIIHCDNKQHIKKVVLQ